MPTETPSILQTIAQDLNRSLFHGARKLDDNDRTRPATVLTGQQAPATEAAVSGGIDMLVDGEPTVLLIAADVHTIFENAKTALSMRPDDGADPRVDPLVAPGNEFFALEPDPAIPTWVYHQRALSLPSRPLVEDLIEAGDRRLLRLPSAALREADADLPATPNPDVTVELSLCQAIDEPVAGTQATRTRIEPLAPADWVPALLARSPIEFAPDQNQVLIPVFELKGIPQDERWYLDQLGLLGAEGKRRALDANAKVALWIEWTALDAQGNPTLKRSEVTRWVIARENLTGLARPGVISLTSQSGRLDLPVTATESEQETTLQLLQMGSITNSGGYYVRAVEVEEELPLADLAALPKNSLWLVVTISLSTPPIADSATRQFPLYANAVDYRTKAVADKNDLLVRFEGPGHISLQPFAPAGMVAFGWRRPIVGKPDSLIQTAEGFARSVHLIDFEITDATAIIDACREVLEPNGANAPKRVWVKEPCSGDTGPALSPLQSLARELADSGDNFAQNRVAALSLEAFTRKESASPSPEDEFWFYRTAVRYDHTNVYGRLAEAARRQLTITSGFRDVFGNRIAPKFASQEKLLTYTDPVVAPSEWPNIAYRILPLGARQVTFSARFSHADQGTEVDITLRKKLMLIRDQLQGAGNEVNVSVVDEDVLHGRAKQKDRFSFGVATGQKLLRDLFLALLDRALAGETFPSEAIIEETILDVGTPTQFGKPTLFLPALVVERDDFLPTVIPDGAPAEDVALGRTIEDLIRRAISPVPLTNVPFPSPNAPLPDPDTPLPKQPEFEEIAGSFETLLALASTPKAAIRRNRFNEHELWFVPAEALPHRLDGEPIFSCARPLSNTREAGEFDLPDYPRSGLPSVGEFNGFPLVRTKVPAQDFDLLGRACFEFVDRALTPKDLTSPDELPAWTEILRLKRGIATLLGDPDKGYLVPVFTGETPASEGQKRMATDAFERNLAGFYSIDTIAQFCVELPKLDALVNNFYGSVTPTFEASSSAATKPTFSDFVLNVLTDGTGVGQQGILTLLYDLAPGEEDRWRDFKTKELEVKVTHLQLPVPGDAPVHEFDQGQWLKLANELKFTVDLGAADPLQIPAVERRFPAEPIFRSCEALKAGEKKAPVAELAKWRWDIRFLTENSQADSLFLTVDYNQPEPPAAPTGNTGFQEDAAAFTTVNLLHALVALEQLSRHWAMLRAAGDTDPANALKTFQFLLERLLHHLPGGSSALEEGTTPDRFIYHTGTGTTDVHPGNVRVKHLTVIPAEAPEGAFRGYTALADDFISLFGDDRAFNFQPSLRLKRNDHLSDTKPTTPSLVYECGPVIWPTPVRVTNEWLEPIIVPPDTASVTEILKRNLRGIFGNADLKSMALCFDVRHVWVVGHREAITPHNVFPVNLQYDSVDDLAATIATYYSAKLTRAGGSFDQFFKFIQKRRLRLKIQVSEPSTTDRPAGRRWLEVSTLEFDLSLTNSLA